MGTIAFILAPSFSMVMMRGLCFSLRRGWSTNIGAWILAGRGYTHAIPKDKLAAEPAFTKQ